MSSGAASLKCYHRRSRCASSAPSDGLCAHRRLGIQAERTSNRVHAIADGHPSGGAGCVDTLADSLRPDFDESTDGRGHILPRPTGASPALLLAVPTVRVARGRLVGEPVPRREFRRTELTAQVGDETAQFVAFRVLR
jgi:hypothetical protein